MEWWLNHVGQMAQSVQDYSYTLFNIFFCIIHWYDNCYFIFFCIHLYYYPFLYIFIRILVSIIYRFLIINSLASISSFLSSMNPLILCSIQILYTYPYLHQYIFLFLQLLNLLFPVHCQNHKTITSDRYAKD